MTTPISPTLLQTWAHEETTFNVAPAMVIGDSIAVNHCKLTPKYDYQAMREQIGTASPQLDVPVKRMFDWEIDADIKPAGAGVQTHLAALLRCAFGTETVNGGVSVVYTISGDTNQRSFSLTKFIPGNSFCEVGTGAFVKKMVVTVNEGKLPSIKFSGQGASYASLFGVPQTTAGPFNSGTASVTLGAGHAWKVLPGMRVNFAADNNGGVGYLVQSINTTGLTLTLSTNLGVTINSISNVTPFVPSFQVTGLPVGRPHGFSLGGTALDMIQSILSFDTGIRGIDNEGTIDTFNGLYVDERSLELETDFYLRDANASLALNTPWGARFAGVSSQVAVQAAALRAGPATAGSTSTFNLPAVRVRVSEVPTPMGGPCIYKMKGRGRYSAVYQDELNLICN